MEAESLFAVVLLGSFLILLPSAETATLAPLPSLCHFMTSLTLLTLGSLRDVVYLG
jgi:hypothetical protein